MFQLPPSWCLCRLDWPAHTHDRQPLDMAVRAICSVPQSINRSIGSDNYLLSLIGLAFLRDVGISQKMRRHGAHKTLIVIHGGHEATSYATQGAPWIVYSCGVVEHRSVILKSNSGREFFSPSNSRLGLEADAWCLLLILPLVVICINMFSFSFKYPQQFSV